MRYLLDTNHCSYIQQQSPEVVAHVQQLPSEAEIVTSVITQGELLAGIKLITSERRKQQLQNLYQTILTITSDILVVDSQVSQAMQKFLPTCDKRVNRSPQTICGLPRLPKRMI
jgi:predicted nucleic acid-binding protein